MSELGRPDLSGVAQTLLIPLYVRAIESQRPDALLNDEKAVALVAEMDSAFLPIRKIKMDEEDMAAVILRGREIDRRTREFLTRCPQATVVHIGCGLDARFERVDNGKVEWYDLDLPEVIDLHRELVGDKRARYHFLRCSAFDTEWLDALTVRPDGHVLFVAEGVFMYFQEAQVKSLVMAILERFRGAELVFDAFSPLLVRLNNLRFRISRTKMNAHYRWGLARGKDLTRWNDDIFLVGQWFPFDRPEPRLARVRWVRLVPPLAKVMGVFHYRLGGTAK